MVWKGELLVAVVVRERFRALNPEARENGPPAWRRDTDRAAWRVGVLWRRSDLDKARWAADMMFSWACENGSGLN